MKNNHIVTYNLTAYNAYAIAECSCGWNSGKFYYAANDGYRTASNYARIEGQLHVRTQISV